MSATADHDLGFAGPMHFYEGFAWAIPTAFASALASFRFEQGDVLYDSPGPYEALSSAPGGLALQILHPPRSARATPADFDGDRRRTSWESEVVLEQTALDRSEVRQLTTTQGRLLMTLWTGEFAWLEDAGDSPPLPLAARELAGRLADAATAFERPSAPELEAVPGCRFLYVVDLASDASRVKSQTIQACLSELGDVGTQDLRPGAAELEDAARFHPALLIRAHTIPGRSEHDVTQCLRKVLYGGAASPARTEDESATEEGSTSDRFSVARHGLLLQLS